MKKQTSAPLYGLKAKLLERFGRQYVAAAHLQIREPVLSEYIAGRRRLPEDLIRKLERFLDCARNAFLPAEYLAVPQKGGRS